MDKGDAVFTRDLARWYAEGLSLSDIAKKIHTSTTSVFRMFKRLNIDTEPKRRKTKEGSRIVRGNYIWVKVKDHPYANYGGYVREHRLIMEERLGRYLEPDEIVHHINEDTFDNRDFNLGLYKDSPHKSKHANSRIRDGNGRFCGSGKKYKKCCLK